ncbi:hypothetical protein GCM10023339_78690 [Alloalcanivorax gelatiniphagus]
MSHKDRPVIMSVDPEPNECVTFEKLWLGVAIGPASRCLKSLPVGVFIGVSALIGIE